MPGVYLVSFDKTYLSLMFANCFGVLFIISDSITDENISATPTYPRISSISCKKMKDRIAENTGSNEKINPILSGVACFWETIECTFLKHSIVTNHRQISSRSCELLRHPLYSLIFQVHPPEQKCLNPKAHMHNRLLICLPFRQY